MKIRIVSGYGVPNRVVTGMQNPRHYNWLVSRIRNQALKQKIEEYASGMLVDIGCGEKPYRELTAPLVTKHIGIDHIDTKHNYRSVDIFASAYNTSLPGNSTNTILCTAVLEHLERPQKALNEMYRILKPGGHVILTVPLFWHIHEEPRDFFRYTAYGLDYLFSTAGFQTLEILPLSGFLVTFSQELCYFLERYRYRKSLSPAIKLTQFGIQRFAYHLRTFDNSSGFTWLYLVVAKK